MLKAIVLIIAINLSSSIIAQSVFTEEPKLYKAHKTNQPPKIDGIIQKKEWNKASWSDLFVDIEGSIKPAPLYATNVKMLWDDSTLYILAKLQEPHIAAKLTDRDAIIFRDNDFEVFVDPDDDTNNYYEIEINAFGTIMDLLMNKPYKKGGTFDMNWNASNMKCAIGKIGTINQPNDIDSAWMVEIAIPINTFNKNMHQHLPLTQQTWRINFSRVQWEYDIVDGMYKKREENGRPMRENNWVWSAMGIIDMHLPERWGYLVFAE